MLCAMTPQIGDASSGWQTRVNFALHSHIPAAPDAQIFGRHTRELSAPSGWGRSLVIWHAPGSATQMANGTAAKWCPRTIMWHASNSSIQYESSCWKQGWKFPLLPSSLGLLLSKVQSLQWESECSLRTGGLDCGFQPRSPTLSPPKAAFRC